MSLKIFIHAKLVIMNWQEYTLLANHQRCLFVPLRIASPTLWAFGLLGCVVCYVVPVCIHARHGNFTEQFRLYSSSCLRNGNNDNDGHDDYNSGDDDEDSEEYRSENYI